MATIYIPDREYKIITIKTEGKPEKYVRELITASLKSKGWLK